MLKFSIKNKETEPIKVPVSLGCYTVQTELELDLLHFQISKSLNFRVRVTDSFFEFCKSPTHIDKRVFEANEKTEIRKGKDSIRCSLQVLNTFSIQLWKWHLSSIVI